MADIAQLGIAVDTSQTKIAARELDNLAQAGGRAEASTQKLEATSRKSMADIAAATQRGQQALERMAAAQERQEKLTEQMARQMQEFTRATNAGAGATNGMAQAANNAAQALGKQSAAARDAQASIGGVAGKLLATVAAVVSLNDAVSRMDAWTVMNNRLKLVTDTQTQFAQAQANIIGIANSTQQPLAETAQLYQRLAASQKTLGLSGTELAGIVKTISQSMVVGGASAAGEAAALMQLGQAFNSGVLRGEEFNSVMEQAPGLMQTLAAGMGKTVGEMRGLAEAGKITTAEIVKALQSQAQATQSNFDKMTGTISGAMNVASNNMTEFIGRMNDATGTSALLAGAITGVANNIGPLATMTATLAAVGLATWFTSATAAAGGFAVAATAVGTAMKGLMASMGPAGWLILGLGAAATAWQLFGDKAQTAGRQTETAADNANAAASKLVAGIVPALNTAIAAYDKMIEKQKQAAGTAKMPIDDAAAGLKAADANLQALAQQVARAQQGVGEYAKMSAAERVKAEKAVTAELEKASLKRGELAKKEAEYNTGVVAAYVKGKERQTDASARLLQIEEAKGKRDAALAAAGADRAKQEAVQSAYRVEIANIEESYAKKGASAKTAAARAAKTALKDETDAMADLAGVSGTYYKDLANYQKQLASKNITEADYIKLVEKLIQKQPFAIALAKEQADAWKEQEKARKDAYDANVKAYDDETKAAERSAQQVTDRVAQMQIEEEAAAIAASGNLSLAQAIEQVTIARLEEQAAIARDAGKQEVLDALQAEIKARKDLMEVTGQKEARESNTKAAKDAADAWKRTADKIEDSLIDALMNGGKSGAEYIEDLFRTMVLRPVLQVIVSPVAGAVTSALGFGGGNAGSNAGSGGAGVGDVYNAYKAASSGSMWFNDFGTAVGNSVYELGGQLTTAGFEQLGSSATSAANTISGFSTQITTAGNALSYLNAASLPADGRWGAAAGSAIGTYVGGPIGGSIGAQVGSLVDDFFAGDAGTMHTGGAGGYSAARGTFRTNEALGPGDWWNNGYDKTAGGIKGAQELSKIIVTTLDTAAATFGQKAGHEVWTGFADDASSDPAWSRLFIKNLEGVLVNTDKKFADGEKGQAEYAQYLADATRGVLEGMDLPGWANAILEGLGDTPTIEQLTQAVAYFADVQAALVNLGDYMPQLANLSEEAASQMIRFFGGAENMVAASSSYYQAFYTETERADVATRQLTESLAAIGVDAMPATREAFRALVESQDLTTESGRETYAALMGLSGSFAALVPATESAAAATDDAAQAAETVEQAYRRLTSVTLTAEQVASQRIDLEGRLLQLQGDTAAIRAKELEAIDPSNRALQDRIWALEDEQAATAAAEAAHQSMIDMIGLSADSLSSLFRNVLSEATDAESARKLGEQAARGMIADAIANTMIGTVSNIVSTAILQPMTAQLVSAATVTGTTIAAGGVAAADALDSVVAQAVSAASSMASVLSDSGFESVMKSVVTAVGEISGTLFDSVSPFQSVADSAENAADSLNSAAQHLSGVYGFNVQNSIVDFFGAEHLLKPARQSINPYSTSDEVGNSLGMLGAAFSKLQPAVAASKDLESGSEYLGRYIAGFAKNAGDSAAAISTAAQYFDDISSTIDTVISAANSISDTINLSNIDPANRQSAIFATENKDLLATIGGGAKSIADTIIESVAGSMIDSLEANPVFSGILGPDLEALGITLSQVGKGDLQGLSEAFDTLSVALASGVINTDQYNAAIGVAQDAFKGVADAADDAAKSTETVAEAYARLTSKTKTNADIAQEQISLEERLFNATATTAEAADAARNAIDPLNRALYDEVLAAEAAKAAKEKQANEQISLEERLHQMLGNSAALRAKELDTLDESNKALQLHVWAVEDARNETNLALQAVERAIQAEKDAIQKASDLRLRALQEQLSAAQRLSGVEQSALQLLGDTVALRQREVAAMDDASAALQRKVWAVEDAAGAMDKALATVQRSVGAERDRITQTTQDQIKAIQSEIDARQQSIADAQKSVSDLQGIFDGITDAVKTLRGNAQDEQQQIQQARAYIDMSLSVAKAGGSVNATALRDAMGVVTQDRADVYASGAEYRYQQARQAAVLDELGGIVGGRIGAAESQLEALNSANTLAQDQIKIVTEASDAQLRALDAQLRAAEDAVSATKGVDLSVIGVGAALTQLDEAIQKYEAARDTLAREALQTGFNTVTALETMISNEQASTAAMLLSLDDQLSEAQKQVDAINGVDKSVMSVEVAIRGLSSAIAAQRSAQDATTPAVVDTDALPSFDVGTNYVPRDMVAKIHQGEAIVPREFNPAIFNQSSASNGELVQLVAALTGEVQRLQAIVQEGNREQRRTANAVNGQGEAPILVETV